MGGRLGFKPNDVLNKSKNVRKSNTNASQICKDCPKKIHLILYANVGKDKNTFKHASLTLKKDYKKHYPNDKVVIKGFTSGLEFVNIIDEFDDNSIVSLDVVSHGNMFGVHVSKKLDPPIFAPEHHLYWHPALRHKSMTQHTGKSEQTVEDAKFMEEKVIGLYTNRVGVELVARFFNQNTGEDSPPPLTAEQISKAKEYSESIKDSDAKEVLLTTYKKTLFTKSRKLNREIKFIEDLDKDKFDSNVFVEFHGCRIGEELPVLSRINENFAEELAEYLDGEPTVVAHISNNNPNNKNGNQNDYRHNKVRVYTQNYFTLLTGASSDKPVERLGLKFPNSSTP